MLNKLIAGAILLAVLSWCGLLYGNSLEKNDMSNAGLQVFGALGTVFFSAVALLLVVVSIWISITKKVKK